MLRQEKRLLKPEQEVGSDENRQNVLARFASNLILIHGAHVDPCEDEDSLAAAEDELQAVSNEREDIFTATFVHLPHVGVKEEEEEEHLTKKCDEHEQPVQKYGLVRSVVQLANHPEEQSHD